MAKIYLVRHAESVANAKGIYQGQTYDEGLSDLGKKQVHTLLKYFKDMNVEEILSSPLRRCYETAEVIADELGLDVETDNNLIETNHGSWEGKSKLWIEKNSTDLYNLWLDKPSEVVFPKGEPFSRTIERVGQFLDDYLWGKSPTVVVTHDNIIRIMLCLSKGIEMNDMWEIDLDSAGITILDVKEGFYGRYYRVVKINEVAHLGRLKSNLKKQAL